MKSRIILITTLLFFLSCKHKRTKHVNTEINSEVIENVKSGTVERKQITEDEEHKIKTNNVEKTSNCDFKTLIKINSLLEKGIKLNDQNFDIFFANMNPDCSNNAEYSEFNNELIFKTLESNPKKFITSLSRISKKKAILEFVLTQLGNPIHDGIDLNSIYNQLDKTETDDSKMKELVSESIKKAIEKT